MSSIRIRAWPHPARWLEELNERLERGLNSLQYFRMTDILVTDLLRWLKGQPVEYFVEKGVGKIRPLRGLCDCKLKDSGLTFDTPSPTSSYPNGFRHPDTITSQELLERYGKRGPPDPSNNNHSCAKNYIRTQKKRVTQQDLNFADDHDILTHRGGPNPEMQAAKRRRRDVDRAKASAVQWATSQLMKFLPPPIPIPADSSESEPCCDPLRLRTGLSAHEFDEKIRTSWEYRREIWSNFVIGMMEHQEAIRETTEGSDSEYRYIETMTSISKRRREEEKKERATMTRDDCETERERTERTTMGKEDTPA